MRTTSSMRDRVIGQSTRSGPKKQSACRTFVRDVYGKFGLAVHEPLHYGSWSGREPRLSFQDIVIATKTAS